jgi:AmiR/NasT family two-component response regulator
VADTHRLRILIANQRLDRLELLAQVVEGLGHDVVGREIDVHAVGALTARERPDVAIVGLGASSTHALDLVSAIVRTAFCPVIAVLPVHDAEWVNAASIRGLYAHLLDDRPAELQSALDITLRRFAEYQALQGAFERRNAEAARDEEFARLRQQRALELHDEIVQGLAVADLALKLGETDVSQKALSATLVRARAIVNREMRDLQSRGRTVVQLISDTSASGDG